jgi:hypothetical protein
MIGFPVGLTLVNRRASAFLGRRCGCGAGGHSIRNTGPESTVPAAAPGGVEGGFSGREPPPARGALG